MKRQRVNTVSLVLVLAMLCAVRGKGLRTRSAFVVSVWRPRVRATKRSLALGAALGDRYGGLTTAHTTTHTAHTHTAHTARWRQSTVRPAAGLGGLGGLGGTPLPLPTQSLSPLSTLDRLGSAFSPQHPHEPDLMPVTRSPGGHLRTDVKVKLTKAESKLFATLLEMVEQEKMGTTLRVAGGWVRDKLVGQEQGFHQRHLSKVDKMDIDIALDNCMGGDFATKLSRYLSKRKGGSRMSKVALIASNPEKSKHLETATLRIDNFWVDFVNLRTESYLQDSRIPSINIGTPMEDAFRRDLTINSLFYNVNTGTVEDYTGKGTSDLRLGLVRTPLPACETLLDDPLRVLRAVRFASRLGFRVHPELMNAGRDPRVHEALCTKVSRERVGCELDQMVRSAAPLRAFQLMDDMDLLPMVFPLPEKFVLPTDDDGPRAYEFGMVYLKNMYHLLDREQLELDGFNPLSPPSADEAGGAGAEAAPAAAAAAAAAAMVANEVVKKDVGGGGGGVAALKAKVKAKVTKAKAKGESTAAKEITKGKANSKGGGGAGGGQGGSRGAGGGVEAVDEEEMRRLGIYAAFLLPLANSMCADQKRAAKNVPMIHVMMSDCLKLRAKDPERVIQLLSAAMDFQLLVRKAVKGPLTRANKTISLPRLAPGLTLRAVGPMWRIALVLGLTGDLGTRHILANSASDRDRADRDQDAAIIKAYVTMAREIESMGLEGVWNLKPMFNGGEIKAILPRIPRGPAFSDVMNEQISWMIDNPGASKEEGREFVQTRFEQFC